MTKELLLELAIHCLIVSIAFSHATAFIILCTRRAMRVDTVRSIIAVIFWITGVGILAYAGINAWILAAGVTPMLVGIMKILIERHK